jgi:hypothetical protein
MEITDFTTKGKHEARTWWKTCPNSNNHSIHDEENRQSIIVLPKENELCISPLHYQVSGFLYLEFVYFDHSKEQKSSFSLLLCL